MRVENNAGIEVLSGQLTGAGKADGAGFADKLRGAIEAVNEKQLVADDHLQSIAAGEQVDLHSAMIAMQEADITLRAMVSVRDKVVDGYQQLMNMSI